MASMSMTFAEIVDVGRDRNRADAWSLALERCSYGDAFHVRVAAAQQFVGAVLNPAR